MAQAYIQVDSDGNRHQLPGPPQAQGSSQTTTIEPPPQIQLQPWELGDSSSAERPRKPLIAAFLYDVSWRQQNQNSSENQSQTQTTSAPKRRRRTADANKNKNLEAESLKNFLFQKLQENATRSSSPVQDLGSDGAGPSTTLALLGQAAAVERASSDAARSMAPTSQRSLWFEYDSFCRQAGLTSCHVATMVGKLAELVPSVSIDAEGINWPSNDVVRSELSSYERQAQHQQQQGSNYDAGTRGGRRRGNKGRGRGRIRGGRGSQPQSPAQPQPHSVDPAYPHPAMQTMQSGAPQGLDDMAVGLLQFYNSDWNQQPPVPTGEALRGGFTNDKRWMASGGDYVEPQAPMDLDLAQEMVFGKGGFHIPGGIAGALGGGRGAAVFARRS